MNLWTSAKSITQNSCRVLLKENGELIKNDKGDIAFRWLWDISKEMPVCQIWKYHMEDKNKEIFAPILILNTYDIKTYDATYGAPISFLLYTGGCLIALFWWAWWQLQFSIEWTNYRSDDDN
jgi:hypothetical protein